MNFKTKKRIRFRHCDPAGIIFYAEVFNIAHDIYEDFLNEAGFNYKKWFENETWAVPAVSTKADYSKPLMAGNEIEGRVAVAEIGESSFQVKIELDENCTVQTTHVFIDRKTLRPTGIPQEVREFLQAHQAQ